MKRKNFITFFLTAIIIFLVSFWFWQKQQPNSNIEKTQTFNITNPASQNCLNKGGQLEILKNNLGEYGVCVFENNYQCEEWALLRDECPLGGVEITNYNSESEKYCVITGNQVKNDKCILRNQKSCLLNDFYNGDCR